MMSGRNLSLSLTSGLLLGLPWSVFVSVLCHFRRLVAPSSTGGENPASPEPHHPIQLCLCQFPLMEYFGNMVDHTGTVVGGRLHHVGQCPCTGSCFLVHKPRSNKPEHLPVLPFLMIWMGYEHFHESWDLAWPWLNLGNALPQHPNSFSGLSIRRVFAGHALDYSDQCCDF